MRPVWCFLCRIVGAIEECAALLVARVSRMPELRLIMAKLMQEILILTVQGSRLHKGLYSSCVLQAMDAATQQMDILGGWEFRERAEAMLKQVGILSSAHLVGKMSGGQKRRVALAAALLASPDLIIADEPTNHMDHQVMSR